jgi:hypothetical protein
MGSSGAREERSNRRYQSKHKENHHQGHGLKDLVAVSTYWLWWLVFVLVEGFEPEFHGRVSGREHSFPCGAATLEWGKPLQCPVERSTKSRCGGSGICLVFETPGASSKGRDHGKADEEP